MLNRNLAELANGNRFRLEIFTVAMQPSGAEFASTKAEAKRRKRTLENVRLASGHIRDSAERRPGARGMTRTLAIAGAVLIAFTAGHWGLLSIAPLACLLWFRAVDAVTERLRGNQ